MNVGGSVCIKETKQIIWFVSYVGFDQYVSHNPIQLLINDTIC